jgi:hypothetical protein
MPSQWAKKFATSLGHGTPENLNKRIVIKRPTQLSLYAISQWHSAVCPPTPPIIIPELIYNTRHMPYIFGMLRTCTFNRKNR